MSEFGLRVSRREFIKRATTAAVAAPYVISASAIGGEARPAPSNRIAMACIGIGNMGSGNLQSFLGHGDVQMVAVCDVDRRKREQARSRVDSHYAAARSSGTYKGCLEFADFRELAARDDIDAVMIAVPDHWHALISIECAKHGKDIYCEKPLSLTIREARAMVNAVRRYGRVFQTGSQQRSDGNFRFACELVRNGRIGKVKAVYVNVGGPSSDLIFPEQPVPEGFDWNMWLGPAPWRPYNAEACSGDYGGGWRRVRDFSGGGMTDWGAHHFDIAQWGLGMDESGPVEIIPPDGKEYRCLTYKYANGVVMYHTGHAEGHGNVNGVLFVGTDGKVEVNRGYLKTWPEELAKQPIGPNEINLYKSPGHHADFLQCVKSRKRPICDVEIGCRSVTVCHLGNIAYWIKRKIRWDPVKEEIIGDEGASRWLDRPKRAPWRL